MIIAGLGNPGKKYDFTRHNFGFWAVDAIADKFHVDVSNKKNKSVIGNLEFRGIRHFLVKPQTFMNLSGEAISSIMIENEIPQKELLVIVDDVNLPVGRIRLRSSGSDGGHNGLKSIIQYIGKGFWRLRVGVGAPVVNDDVPDETSPTDLVEHVLGNVSESEMKIYSAILTEIPEIIAHWLLGMGNTAMTKYNGLDFNTIGQ